MFHTVQFEAKFPDLGTCYILRVIGWEGRLLCLTVQRPCDYSYLVVSLFASENEAIGVARFLSTFSLEVVNKVYDQAIPLHVFAEEERKKKEKS